MTHKQAMVFVGKARWCSPPARHRHMAQAMSKSFDILYLEDGGSIWPRCERVGPSIVVVRGLLRWFDKAFWTKNNLYALFPSYVINFLMWKYDKVIVWDMENCHDLLRYVRAEIRIFDHIDPCFSKDLNEIQEFDDRVVALSKSAHLVFATSRKLLAEVHKHNKRAQLLPNAASGDMHAGDNVRDIDICYSGALDSRLDYDFIRALVKLNPMLRTVIVGRYSEFSSKYFDDCENVLFVGEKSEDETNKILMRSKYGLIPYLRSEIADCLNPAKLFHYISYGVVPLCLPTAELSYYKNYCMISDDLEEWREIVTNYLLPSNWDRRSDFLIENTWSTRAGMVTRLLSDYGDAK